MNQELNKLTFTQITPFHIIVKPASGHVCYPFTSLPCLQPRQRKLYMWKDYGGLEIIAFTGMGNALRLIIKGLLGDPNFELGLKNDLVMYEKWKRSIQ